MKKLHSLFLMTSLFLVKTTYAANEIGLDPAKQPGGIKINRSDIDNPGNLIGTIIQNSLTLFFTIGALGFVIMFVWGSVDWILSGGDKEKIAGARKRIVTAITGLVILSLTFVVMVILGQILGLSPLYSGNFKIPSFAKP